MVFLQAKKPAMAALSHSHNVTQTDYFRSLINYFEFSSKGISWCRIMRAAIIIVLTSMKTGPRGIWQSGIFALSRCSTCHPAILRLEHMPRSDSISRQKQRRSRIHGILYRCDQCSLRHSSTWPKQSTHIFSSLFSSQEKQPFTDKTIVVILGLERMS